MDSDDGEPELTSFGCDRTGCMCPGGRCQFGNAVPSSPHKPPELKPVLTVNNPSPKPAEPEPPTCASVAAQVLEARPLETTSKKRARTPRNRANNTTDPNPAKSTRKRKRATSIQTPRKRKPARGPPGQKKRAAESSSEGEDAGIEVPRTRNDAFEIRFNHLYKPDPKLPDARYSFGQCKGKFVSEVVVGGTEALTDGVKNERFRGIAYLRWMLSAAFKPRPGNAKLLRAVRAHAKAYDQFMNTVEPLAAGFST